jgi:ribonucleoside-diphosphate reductase alpha chain
MAIKRIRKRDGRVVDFEQEKITNAIFKAARAVGGEDYELAKKLSDQVVKRLEEKFVRKIPSVEDVQDIVEKVLIENGHAKTAKAYILYRKKREKVREAKKILGVRDELKLPVNTIKVLKARYLLKDEEGEVVESTSELFRRVAKHIVLPDILYHPLVFDKQRKQTVKDVKPLEALPKKAKELGLNIHNVEMLYRAYKRMNARGYMKVKFDELIEILKRRWKEIETKENKIYEMLTKFEFVPNSPTLMNAGAPLGQLSACFVLPVDDSLNSIFDALKSAALIHQCLVPETLVMTDKGLSALGSIKGSKIVADDGLYDILKVHNNGIKPVFKVTTTHGFEITGTAEHRLLVMAENGEPSWKRIKQLKNGDWLILNSGGWMGKDVDLPEFEFNLKKGGNRTSFKPSIFKLPKKLTPELAELIGLYIGDGSNHRDGIRFTVSDKERDMISRIEFLSKKLFSRHVTIRRAGKSTLEVSILSRQIKEWFKFLGVTKQNARNAIVPEILFKAPKDVVFAFLRGLFSTDGCVRRSGHITLTSASIKLLKTVQVMMLHLGIPTRFYHNELTDVYQLSICSKEGFLNFKQKIGFIPKFKQDRLLNIDESKIFTRGETIPHQRDKLRQWYDNIPYGKHKIVKSFVDDIINRNDFRQLTVQRINRMTSELCKDTVPEFFNDIINSKYFFVRVDKVESAGRQKVVDLTIPIKHAYIANGFVTHNSGGGTGFSFSRLRPNGDMVKSTKGIASGPISFMRVFDVATEVIKQGGKRRGANMGILRIDHPDIMDFVTSKDSENRILTNFNISVAITDKFMRALERNSEYELINPRTKKVVKKLLARQVWEMITYQAWKTGDPGLVFIDEINRHNQTPNIGKIEATNPCGEQPLLPYESCNLGSINLSKMVKKTKGGYEIDWEKLREVTKVATHFLDNVVDANRYPIQQIEFMTLANRRIGLGVMGFADLLIKLGIPYASEKALKLGERIMKFITEAGREYSISLGKTRGNFPNFKGSIWDKKGYKYMRNCAITTIAPTGTISIIANTSSGIEPLFAVAFVRRHVLGGEEELVEINPLFEEYAKKHGFYSEELMKEVSRTGSVQEIKGIPDHAKKLFVTAHDIDPEWHIKMQAAFQKYTDNAVSKTINLRAEAGISDVENAYLLAYKLKCKGITIYRDLSKTVQVIHIGEEERERRVRMYITMQREEGKIETLEESEQICPVCRSKLYSAEGCFTCLNCGYSKCT